MVVYSQTIKFGILSLMTRDFMNFPEWSNISCPFSLLFPDFLASYGAIALKAAQDRYFVKIEYAQSGLCNELVCHFLAWNNKTNVTNFLNQQPGTAQFYLVATLLFSWIIKPATTGMIKQRKYRSTRFTFSAVPQTNFVLCIVRLLNHVNRIGCIKHYSTRANTTAPPNVWVVTDGGIESTLQAMALGKQLTGSNQLSKSFKVKTIVASKSKQVVFSVLIKYFGIIDTPFLYLSYDRVASDSTHSTKISRKLERIKASG